jgi:hypothetical protein
MMEQPRERKDLNQEIAANDLLSNINKDYKDQEENLKRNISVIGSQIEIQKRRNN